MIKVEAYFKGKNGSMGYVRGQMYFLWVTADNGCILIEPVREGQAQKCKYGSITAFLANWTRVCEVG